MSARARAQVNAACSSCSSPISPPPASTEFDQKKLPLTSIPVARTVVSPSNTSLHCVKTGLAVIEFKRISSLLEQR
jgi:hypothetical protein